MNYSYIKKKSTQKIIENTNLCKKKRNDCGFHHLLIHLIDIIGLEIQH